MTIITKGMGAIMKFAMKKAKVKKPTFPGPRSTEILNKRLKKKQKFRTGNIKKWVKQQDLEKHFQKI